MRLSRHLKPLLAVVLLLNLASMVVAPNIAVSQDRPPLTYFALGDSYASGHGLPDEVGTGNDGAGKVENCRRSQSSYPYLVTSGLGETYTVDLHHFACSGATAGSTKLRPDDTRYHPDKSLSHQVETAEAFLDERDRTGNTDPVLITITIGANDLGIDGAEAEAIKQVFQPVSSNFTGPEFFEWLDGKTAIIDAGLTDAINRLLDHENIRIVLTDYPNPFREGGFAGACQDFFDSLTCDERMEHLMLSLTASMAKQVSRVDDRNHLHFATLGSRFASHYSNCGPFSMTDNAKETWFQDQIQVSDYTRLINNAEWNILLNDLIANMDQCFHPNGLGHQAIADAVVDRALTMLPASAGSPPTPEQGNDWIPIYLGAPFGPFGHEIGAVFTVSTTDGVYLGTCTLEGDPAAEGLLNCQVDAPPDTDIVVTLDVDSITPGTLPGRNPVIFRTPSASDSWPGSVYFHSVPREYCENGDDPKAIECILDPEQFPNSSAHDPDYAPRYYLPWEAGSVWQITAGNGEGKHSGPDKSYAFDAVPVPGQGSDKVVAIGEGTVFDFQESMPDAEIPNGSHAGNCVIILHDNGDYSLYAHLAQDSVPLAKGQHVAAGTVIGTMGNSGYSMGRHLHWALLDTAWMYTDADVSPYRTCAGTTIESFYFDDDPALTEDGYVPRTGRSYTSSNGVTEPVQSPAPDSTAAATVTSVTDMSEGWAPMDFGAFGPNGHEIGAEFSVTLADGTAIGSCILEGDAADPELLACQVDVPTNTDIVVTLNVDSITPGYVPVENPIALNTGDYPGTSPWGVFFQLVLLEDTESEGNSPEATTDPGDTSGSVEEPPESTEVPASTEPVIQPTDPDGEATVPPMPEQGSELADMDIGASGPNGHEIGAEFSVTTGNGDFLGSCILDGNAEEPYPLSCQVPVPRYTTVVVTLDVDTITPGFVPVENPLYFDTSSEPGAASHWGVFFEIEPGESTGNGEGLPDSDDDEVISDSDVSVEPGRASGSTDIALITRDPAGDLLTGTCYVLAGFSNQGCDENGDGQVIFADVPFDTYTVRQTRTPAGYPTIEDFEIDVAPTGYMEGPSFGVPLGFIVKQAPEQNAPNTRNVSVVFLDMSTHERVPGGGCVELIGASLVGCDRDLVDGQVDFLDVPAGGPYELSFSNLPAGREVGEVGGPLAVTIDAGPGDPANVMIFVLLAGSGDAGDTTDAGSTTIVPPDDDSSSRVQVPGSSDDATEATVLMTFRACPEDFDPGSDDPYAACTIPLDAPDASLVGEWGVGGSLVPITSLERQYNGEYVFHVSSNGSYYLELTGLEPVLRDDFIIYGIDYQDGSSFIALLSNGETREIFIFYYYE